MRSRIRSISSRISGHVHAAVAELDHPGLSADGVAGLTQMAYKIAWRDR